MANASKTKKYVYAFGNKKADGDGSMKALLGGKGANLAEMTRIGLPVPPGFTITTEVCTYYYAHKRTYPKELTLQMKNGVAAIENLLGKKFGDLATHHPSTDHHYVELTWRLIRWIVHSSLAYL